MNVMVAYHLSATHDVGACLSLSDFPKDTTSELAGFIFKLLFMLSAKQVAVNANFRKSLVRPYLESNYESTASNEDSLSHSANSRSFVLQ